MAYVFFDESGDLGYDFTKKRTSRYFIATFLFALEKRPIDRAVKKTFTGLPPRCAKGHPGVLHAVKELPQTRRRLLCALADADMSILVRYMDKQGVQPKNEHNSVPYNAITNALLDCLAAKKCVPVGDSITLIASRRETSKALNHVFSYSLEENVKRNHTVELEVKIKTPHQEKGLQAVDFISWAIFRRLEMGDSSYYDIFSHKIIEEGIFKR